MKYAQGSFITVPSRQKLDGMHPTAQCLYMWLCAYANETGNCFPSRTTLANNVGCSDSMVDNMLSLLEKEGLVAKKARKEGDKQLTNLYTVIVDTLPRGTTPLPHSTPPPSHDVGTELNPILTQTSEVPLRVEREQPESRKLKGDTRKYPNARLVFSWFPKQQPFWNTHSTELKHAEMLFTDPTRGEVEVKKRLRYLREHAGEEFLPQIDSPYDLNTKWEKLSAYAKRNS